MSPEKRLRLEKRAALIEQSLHRLMESIAAPDMLLQYSLHEPRRGQLGDRRRHAGQHPGMAEGVPEDERSDPQPRHPGNYQR